MKNATGDADMQNSMQILLFNLSISIQRNFTIESNDAINLKKKIQEKNCVAFKSMKKEYYADNLQETALRD